MLDPVMVAPNELQLKLLRALGQAPMPMKNYLRWAKEHKIEHRLDFLQEMVNMRLVEHENVHEHGVSIKLVS